MNKLKIIGIILIIFSFIAWGGIFALPLFNLSAGIKVSVGGLLVIIGEVFFWSGSLLIGKEIVKRFFSKLLKKKDKAEV
ncbi:MAG: hypothetical protein K0R71_1085 [Bacillales bacterium]|jgi:hypothetical protein|nr:hypothetical protein [Bacillales bacterium]